MENEIKLIKNHHLSLLGKILNYQIPFTGMLLGYVIFAKAGIIFIISLFALAALIFTPYLLYVLKRENQKGWIYLFVAIVVIPVVIAIVMYFIYPFLLPILFYTLGLFYFYCFLLRFSVNDWLKGIRSKNQYLLEKKERDEQLKAFMEPFQ